MPAVVHTDQYAYTIKLIRRVLMTDDLCISARNKSTLDDHGNWHISQRQVSVIRSMQQEWPSRPIIIFNAILDGDKQFNYNLNRELIRTKLKEAKLKILCLR